MRLHNIFTVVGIIAAAAWFTVCDKFFHINTGLLVYYWQPLDIIFKGQSVWTFPIFCCATTGFFIATLPFGKQWKENPGYVSMAVNGAVY